MFGPRNGAATYQQFAGLIHRNRHQAVDANSEITCTVLNAPIFFREADWISAPADWADGIVQGKGYSDLTPGGQHLWAAVQAVLPQYQSRLYVPGLPTTSPVLEEALPQYGLTLRKMRLGQGAFRATVMEAYGKRCAISGEKTCPCSTPRTFSPMPKPAPTLSAMACCCAPTCTRSSTSTT